MKKYIVEVSETAEQDLENIISYLRYTLSGDIVADKYKILFKQALKDLEDDLQTQKDNLESRIKIAQAEYDQKKKEEDSKRIEMKNLIKSLKKINPDVDDNIFKSIDNVNLNCILGYTKNKEKHSLLDEYERD